MQNFNNIIYQVRVNLGTKTSSIEITDDEFVNHIKQVTLPFFSQVSPFPYWKLISLNDKTQKFMSNNVFVINDINNIIDVHEVYLNNNEEMCYRCAYNNPIDIVLSNALSYLSRSLRPVNDFEFIRPNLIRFSQRINNFGFIVKMNIEHISPDTIPSDLYHKLFIKMCIADCLELVLTNRNKFTSLTTPFGQIDLNTDFIANKIQDLRQYIQEFIDNLPHREYIEIF